MIILCIFLIVILIVENVIFIKVLRQRNGLIKQSYRQTEKFSIFFELTVEWFTSYLSGRKISDWIVENGYKTVAIYGMGVLGELAYSNLCKENEICVKYGIDRRKSIKIDGLNTYSLDDKPERVDLIVVTAVTSYEEIKSEINKKIGFDCNVISLLQLIEKCIYRV